MLDSEWTSARWRRSPAACSADAAFVMCSRTMADVADLAVALAELVVGEADGARVVRGLGLLERAPVQRDGPRLVAARRGEPSVQPPAASRAVRRKSCRGTCRACGRAAASRLIDDQSCRSHGFGERDANGAARLARQACERSAAPASAAASGTAPAFERRRSREKRLQMEGTAGARRRARGRHDAAQASAQGLQRRHGGSIDRIARPLACAEFLKRRAAPGRRSRLEPRRCSRSRRRPRVRSPFRSPAAAAGVRVLHFVEREVTPPSTRVPRRAASRSSRPPPTCTRPSIGVRACRPCSSRYSPPATEPRPSVPSSMAP